MKKLVLFLMLFNAFFIAIPELSAQEMPVTKKWTCLDGLTDCNDWCKDQFGSPWDTPARLVCYAGCAVAYALCETGLVEF